MRGLAVARLLAAACAVLGLSTACSSSHPHRDGHRPQHSEALTLDVGKVDVGHPCGDPGAYGHKHGADLIDQTKGDDLLNDAWADRQGRLATAPPPGGVRGRHDVAYECVYSDHRTTKPNNCIKAIDYITSSNRHHLAVAEPDAPRACSTTPEAGKPYARIQRAIPHSRARTDLEWNCDDEAVVDVPGAHEAHGCTEIALVDFHPGADLDGSIRVFRLPTRTTLARTRDNELRYMRQYAGLSEDVSVPGLDRSRLIHTGSNGDLAEVVFARGQDLVMLWLSPDNARSLRPTELQEAIRIARQVNRLLAVPHQGVR